MRGSVPEPSAGDSPPSDGSGEVLPTAGSPGRDLLADTLPQDEAARAQARALSEAALAPPAQVPGYTLGRQIGAGAFGTVWQAIEQNTGKQVAIKFYTHRRGLDWALLNREVEKLATLHNSRDVVRLLQVGWTAEPPYYVMEYLPQGSLAGRLQPGPLEPGEAAHLAGGIARALACAHEAGILHCDLKPANVLLDAELAPRLADFGQARLSSEQSPALGTLFYMAPEQADLQATPDPRWDVYALGALLYHLLVGQPPHRTPENEIRLRQATTLEEKLAVYRQIVAQEPAPTSHQQRPGVDAQLAAIVDRCLAVDPAQRFPTARAVQEALAARAHYQSLRPALWLGVLLPLVLLAGLVPPRHPGDPQQYPFVRADSGRAGARKRSGRRPAAGVRPRRRTAVAAEVSRRVGGRSRTADAVRGDRRDSPPPRPGPHSTSNSIPSAPRLTGSAPRRGFPSTRAGSSPMPPASSNGAVPPVPCRGDGRMPGATTSMPRGPIIPSGATGPAFPPSPSPISRSRSRARSASAC